MENFVVGIVHHPDGSRLVTVVGHEFLDRPGFYRFCEVGSLVHFRLRPGRFEDLHPVSRNVFRALKGE